jgi:F-type H+-transporting ATPase subunit alpha
MSRSDVKQPLLTGFAVIDALVPVGLGQRQLIIGNKGTGKTTLVLNIIKNQKRANRYFSPESRGRDRIFCVYVAIGLRLQKVKTFLHSLKKAQSDWYTAVIDGSAARPFAQQYLSPFAACTYSEIYRDNGLNALVIYDDLDKHANAYREANLLIRNPSGREAYPGDIFYIHARLLERAAQFSKYYGYGSLTALPVVEIKGDNLNTYIPTNLISITDGQWFLRTDYSKKGLYPALDIEKSVSRIGRKAQSSLMS